MSAEQPGVASRVHLLLRAGGHMIVTAESLTGGQLAKRLTDVPGASDTFLGGVVTYATELKQTLLGVPDEVVKGPGVVSGECAEAMATGARALTGATFALSTTGVAGPAPQEDKPAGTVFVGIAGPGLKTSVALDLDGDRASIQSQACTRALEELERILRREETAVG